MNRTLGGTLVAAAGAALAAAAAPVYLAGHAAAGPPVWARAGVLLAAALGAAAVLVWARRRFAGPGSLAAGGALAALGLGALWWCYPATPPSSFAVLGAALLAVGLHVVCLTAGGAGLLRALGIRGCTRLLYGLLAFLGGWICWGWAAFLLGLGGVFGSFSLAALTLLFALAGRRELLGFLRRWWRSRNPVLGAGAPGTVLLAAVLAFVALAGLLGPTRAASPPIAFDELMYHLAAPRHYLEAGGIDFIPDIRGSYLPALSHMHYALFVALGVDFGAKLVNLAMSVALLLLAFEAGRAWSSRLAGAVAGVLLALTPLTAWVAGTAYLDNALAALGLASALFLLQGIQRGRPPWIVAAGLLAGGALFTRYQAIPLVAALGLVAGLTLAASRRRRRRPSANRRPSPRAVPASSRGPLVGALLLAIGLAVLVPLPHWSRNLWHTGNPVFPLMDHVFATSAWFDAQDLAFFNRTNFDNFGFGRDGLSVLLAPWRLILQESRFALHGQQALGLIWLALLPAAVLGALSRARHLPLALAGLLAFAGWFLTMQVGRYLLPALAIGAVLAGLGVARLARRRPGGGASPVAGRSPGHRRDSHAGLLAALLLVAAASAVLQAPGALATEADLALAGEGRDRFLEVHVPSYRALRQVLAGTPEDSLVWAFMDQGAVYYYPRRVLGDWFGPYKYSRVAASIVPFTFRPGEEVVALLESWGVTHVLLNLPATPNYRAGEVDLEALLAPRDPLLAAHLGPLYGDRGVFVYAFDPAAASAPRRDPRGGANRLLNPSFEMALDGPGGGWGVVGAPAVVPDPLGAPDGELVLRTDLDNYAYQYFPTRPGARYLAGCQARAEGRATAQLRLQVLWIGADGALVDSAIEVRSSAEEGYRRFTASFTAPPAAARGIFHVLGHEADRVRFDDVTLREVGPGAPSELPAEPPAELSVDTPTGMHPARP